MKNIYPTLFIIFNFFTLNTFSQISQNGIFFQAVAKDNYDNPANSRQLYIRSSIIQSNAKGPIVLIEEFQSTTNQMGIFNFTIGKGVRKGGTVSNLNEIDWANGPFFLNIKIVLTPIAPGSNWNYNNEWIDIGTTSFGTVPYALFASSTVENLNKLNITDSITRYVTPSQLASTMHAFNDFSKSLSMKIDKVEGKQLSTNDYSNLDKYKLSEITGFNTGDETNASIKSKLGIATLVGINTGDQDLSSFVTKSELDLKANALNVDSMLLLKVNNSKLDSLLSLKVNARFLDSLMAIKVDGTNLNQLLSVKSNITYVDSLLVNKVNSHELTNLLALKANIVDVDSNIGLKANTSDVIHYLASKADITFVNTNLNQKANSIDVASDLSLKANHADLTSGLLLKVDKVLGKELSTNDYTTTEKNKLAAITGINTGDQDLSAYATNTNLALKANSSDVTTSLALKANSADLTSGLALKEDQLNKSDATNLGGAAASDILFPTQKAVKTYVDGQISSGGVADGSILSRHIATANITNSLIADDAITNAKISSGISPSKMGLSNVENIALSTWQGSSSLINLGTISTGIWSATSIAITNGGTGANSAMDARKNLGLEIGTNVQAPLRSGIDYIVPNTSIIGASKTKITYDINGLVIAGADATTLDIAPSLNRNYVTDIQSNVLSNTSGSNTGDESSSSIKTKLGIAILSGDNTGDETENSIKTKLGITTISGSNTGDQDLSAYATNTNLALKANASDVTTSLALKANTSDVTTSLALKANASDVTSDLALKVDKVTGKELSTNDYTTVEKNKLAAISGTNTGDQDLSAYATNTNLAFKANASDVTTSLALKANSSDVTTSLALKANSADVTTSLALKANLNSPTLVTPVLGDATATSITASLDVKAKRFTQYATSAISSTSTTNIDLSRGNVIQVDLANSISAITFTNEAVGTYLIKFSQTVGSKTVNFPDTWLWSGGVEPTVSTPLGRTDIVTLIYDGTNYYAAIVQNFY